MFNARDDSNGKRTEISISLNDGSVVTGNVRLPLSGRLIDALNGQEPFLDVVTVAGQQQFIAKAAIRSARSAALPRADQLDQAGTGFDPHAVLKLDKGASADEIRAAYHRMARLYHPDRIASYELPEEVMAYVRAMLVRINLAYEQLGR